MNMRLSRLGRTATLLVATTAIPLIGQSATTGVIAGKVTTTSGQPIAGARILFSGAALQGTREAVSDADGNYRIPLVPSGAGYTMRVTKADMVTAEARNISLAGFQSMVQNFALKPTTAQATVEVVASQPNAIDPSTVTVGRTYTTQDTQAMPLASRDFSSVAFLTPGVADSGRGANNPAMAGGSGFENSILVDGMNAGDPVYGRNEIRINNLAVESVQVQTGGFEPEYGRSTGGIISAVTKSGSNAFAFEFEATFQPRSMTAVQSTDLQLPHNSNKFATGDISTQAFWLGGPIIKDKLWYSLGLSTASTENIQSAGAPYFLNPDLVLNANNPLAVPLAGESAKSMSLKTKDLGITSKLTWSINTDNTLEVGLNMNKRDTDTPVANGSLYTLSPYVQSFVANNDTTTISANWRSAMTANWTIDARVGFYQRKTSNDEGSAAFSTPSLIFNNASFVTAGTRALGGLRLGGMSIGGTSDITRKQATIKSTNFWVAHTLKYGIDYDETGYKSFSIYPGQVQIDRSYNVDATTGALTSFVDRYRFRTGAGGQTAIFNNSGTPRNTGAPVLREGQGLSLDSKSKNLSLFVQDSWQATPKLQLIGGIRADSQDLYGGDGQKYLSFKMSDMIAPRVGFTFDPTGAGKYKFYGNYGRFFETVPMDLNQRAGSIEGFYRVTRTYTGPNANPYFIPNMNTIIDPVTGIMAGADPTIGGGIVTHSSTIGGSKSEIDPSIKPQSLDEISFGFETQLTELWKAGFNWRYRYFNHLIEDFSFDFGNNYVIGNPGEGQGTSPAHIVDYDYPGQDEYVYFPKGTRNYRELTLSLSKAKGGDKWSLNAFLTFAFKEGNIDGLDGSPQSGQVDPNITAFYDLPTLTRNSRGPLPGAPKYNFQMMGTYDLPFNMSIGGRFIYQAGTPISAFGPDLGELAKDYDVNGDPIPNTYYQYNGQWVYQGNYGDDQATLEPRGSRGTTPDVTRTDIHLEWNSPKGLFGPVKVTAYLDVFNLWNQQMVTAVNQRAKFQTTVFGSPVDANGAARSGATTAGVIAADNPYFLKPTAYQAPRSLQFGVRLKF